MLARCQIFFVKPRPVSRPPSALRIQNKRDDWMRRKLERMIQGKDKDGLSEDVYSKGPNPFLWWVKKTSLCTGCGCSSISFEIVTKPVVSNHHSELDALLGRSLSEIERYCPNCEGPNKPHEVTETLYGPHGPGSLRRTSIASAKFFFMANFSRCCTPLMPSFRSF